MSSESPTRTSDSSRRPSVEEKQSGAEVAPEDEYVELGEMEEESAADAESEDKVRVDVDAKPGLSRFKLAALRVMRENAVAKRLAMFKALRATDMTSSYAAEYTGAVEAKTVAFHRRLERGAGLELFYTKGKRLPGSYANVKGRATSVGDARLRVVMHAGHGLVWWRGHKFGPVKAFRTRGITHCFAVEDILQVGLLQGDKKGLSFFVKLKRPASVVTWHGGRHVKDSEAFEPFSLVFSAQTRATASIFMGGFELLRRHHTQLFHEDDEVDEADAYSLAPQATPSGLSEEPTLVETATASLRAAAGLKPRKSLVINGKIKATDLQSSKTASFAGAAPLGRPSIHAFTRGGVPAGTARRASDAKAVPAHVLPSHFSIVSSFFEPHRDPTHQHYHQDIQARIVEVYYEAFVEDPDLDLLQQPKIRLPNGNRFRLPTEHFCEGVWCTATVDPNGYDEDRNTYTLIYHEGPFENRKGTVIKIAGFPQGTMFEKVPREHIFVDIFDQPSKGKPYFTLGATFVQVLLYALWTYTPASRGPHGGPSTLALDVVSAWPDCEDQRSEVWRYWGYQFVHGSNAHITFNALVQMATGIPLELAHGSFLVGLVYNLGVVVGALSVMFSDPTTLVVGASGGVYCLFGAHFGHTCLNFHELHRGIFNRWTRFGLLGAFVAIDSYLAYQDLRENKNDASTSYSAHIGGFIAGIGFSSLCFHELVEHSFVEEAVRFGSALVVVVLAVYLAINAAVMDPIKGIHTPVRSEVYCCYQTAYCSGFSKSDNDLFSCSWDGDKYIVWPDPALGGYGWRQPDTTFSCDQLVDWAAGDSAPTAN